MKHMQHTKTHTRSLMTAVKVCCLCFCSLVTVSCISLPGERESEQRNLAAEYYDIALQYNELKQYDKALSCFEKAREKADPADYPKIDYQMARDYALSNKWDKAAGLYGNLLTLDSGNTNLKEAYAYTLYKSGEKEKALQLYAELGKPDPFVKEESNSETENQDQEAIGS